ncbi:MAG TPA: sigma-70 family RNA polymerase sigma factor [Polyangiaceae bacterium]
MNERDLARPSDDLARPFEESRNHLRGVAYRMLGSLSEADDAVQEAWLRLQRTDTTDVANLRGWLTTVVARVCLDMLRAREAHPEEPLEAHAADRASDAAPGSGADPEGDALLADSVGVALLVVLERLEPAERLAFVLHDLFGMSFEEIGPVVARTPAAARQLASRARRRVQGTPATTEADLGQQREVVKAFLRALRGGDFAGIVAVLDPDVVVHTDGAGVGAAGKGPREIRGADAWARGAVAFGRLAGDVHVAMVEGTIGLVFAPRGKLQRVMRFEFAGGRIARAELVSDAARLATMEVGIVRE